MNEESKHESEPTTDGAVELNEQDLDQAGGGVSSGGDYGEAVPTGQGSGGLADKAGQTSVPQDPSIGLLSDPQKKL